MVVEQVEARSAVEDFFDAASKIPPLTLLFCITRATSTSTVGYLDRGALHGALNTSVVRSTQDGIEEERNRCSLMFAYNNCACWRAS